MLKYTTTSLRPSTTNVTNNNQQLCGGYGLYRNTTVNQLIKENL